MLLDKMPQHFRDFLFSQPNGQQIEIRTGLLDDQTIVFHASDLCRLLDLGNPTNAIAFHLDDDEAYKLNVGKHYDEWFVTKTGLYGLMLGSNKPQAKAFKRWLRKEVLVKLEASGGYIMPTATSEQLKALQQTINELQGQQREILLGNYGHCVTLKSFVKAVDLRVEFKALPDKVLTKKVIERELTNSFAYFFYEWQSEQSEGVQAMFETLNLFDVKREPLAVRSSFDSTFAECQAPLWVLAYFLKEHFSKLASFSSILPACQLVFDQELVASWIPSSFNQ